MRKSVDLDRELVKQIEEVQALTREKASTIIRLALRCGLPLVMDRFRVPEPPDGWQPANRDPNKMEPAKPLRRK